MSSQKGKGDDVEDGGSGESLLVKESTTNVNSITNANNRGGSTLVKGVLLIAVVVQNASLNVAARRSRVVAEINEDTTGCGYRSTTAVVVIEVSKICLSILLFVMERYNEYGCNPILALRELARITLTYPFECAKILVPACLYTIQNNLLLVAADNLEGPVLALFGQLKILATALFSVLLLRRALGLRRWISLIILTAAIAMVQISQMHPSTKESHGDEGTKNLALGLAVTALISTISGFSGVYFEMVLKNSPISLWIRNIHLAAFSTLVGLIAVYSTDSDHVARCGFLGGYGPAAWTYVCVQAGGGLLIAAVIKYADNILKAFATSVSIVVVALVSAIFYDFQTSQLFFIGATGVVYAVFLYGDLLKELPICRKCPTWLGGKSTAN